MGDGERTQNREGRENYGLNINNNNSNEKSTTETVKRLREVVCSWISANKFQNTVR